MSDEVIELLEKRILDLESAMKEILLVDENMGLYPKAWIECNSENGYKQRDGYKNGWNSACMEFMMPVISIIEKVLPDDK